MYCTPAPCTQQQQHQQHQTPRLVRLAVGPRAPLIFRAQPAAARQLLYMPAASPAQRVYAFQHAPYLGGIPFGNTTGMQNSANKTALSVFE